MDKRNIAEGERENSVLGASDTPIGTRLGEKLSPRVSSGPALKSLKGQSHAPFNGGSDADVANLPPLNGEIAMHCDQMGCFHC